MRIGIVAGEHSGDLLAAALIEAIKNRVPEAVFEGVAGPRMLEVGCHAVFPIDELAVMGFVEVLGSLGRLLRIRRQLALHFLRTPPDLFIGVDAPDFNLGLARRLKQANIPVVHYVSPSVWAWRRYRVGKIRRSVDRMLTLFPFESAFYKQHNVDARYVGHPLADLIPLVVDQNQARKNLGVEEGGPIIALLPGSRVSEVSRLAGVFIETAKWCWQRRSELRFMVPLADGKTRRVFSSILQKLGGDLPLTVVEGRSHDVMAAADVVLTASGTATLEALLLKRPMVVAYKMAAVTHFLAKRMVHLPYYSLPNLLAEEAVVPELIQDQATPSKLGTHLLEWLDSPEKTNTLMILFDQIHNTLRCGASDRAADAVFEVLER